jgi:hypothetical protein
LISKSDALRMIGCHGQHRRSAKTDDLTGIVPAALADDLARLAHRTERPFRLNQIPYDLTDAATPS